MIVRICALLLAMALACLANKEIVVKNNCKDTLSIGVLTNGKSSIDQTFNLGAGSSQTITKGDQWGGRVWGRHDCSGSSGNSSGSNNCGIPGASNPASLAEFFFKGSGGKDFYDISLVDGYNLHMTITPSTKEGASSGKYSCGAPSCEVPKCDKQYAVVDKSGNLVSCKSSCSAKNTDETCCKGSHDDPNVCKPDQRSEQLKSACPDAYSFAYDDQTSTFECATNSYEVRFC